MKTLIKWLESKGYRFSYDARLDIIIIHTGNTFSWVNGYNEKITEDGYIRIYKLESYKYNNYGVSWNTAVSRGQNKDAKKISDVKEVILSLINK